MKKIGLIQVDGSLCNLALMQIAAYHRAQGDTVEWFKGDLYRSEYDLVYASQMFSFSRPELPAGCIVGGTGIDFSNRLPPEMAAMNPGDAWFLYPDFTAHLGFSQKGCRFRCSFCVVPQKEPGKPWVNASIGELLTNPRGEDRLILLDNDFFGGPNWRDNLLEIQDRKLTVSFCQGLNIRILTEEQAAMLAQTKFSNVKFTARQVTFAWDRWQDRRLIERGIDRCIAAGIPGYQMQFFVLIGFDTTEEQDLERVEYLRSRKCDPYAMPYDKSVPYQRRFARWVNHRAIFNSVPWREYRDGVYKSKTAEMPALAF